MMSWPFLVENGLSYVHRAAAYARNSNITNGISVVPTIVDEAPEVVIDEESDSEGETYPLIDEINVHYI